MSSNALENKRGFQNSSKQHYNSVTLLKLSQQSQQMGNRHIYTYVPIASQNFGQTRLVQCTLSDAKKIMLTTFRETTYVILLNSCSELLYLIIPRLPII